MPPVEEVSFELERFEWTGDDRLEVVGRWHGISGRRMHRPALTVEAAGRRHRITGSADTDGEPEAPWRASFPWDGARGEIASAELELGRSLVVELPPPRRRRRRRAGTEADLRAQIDELRIERESLTAELEAARTAPADDDALAEARAEIERLKAAQVAAPADDVTSSDDELAGLRLAHGSLKAANEQLEDEVDALRGVRDERDEFKGLLEGLRLQIEDHDREKTSLGELMRALQERASAAESERDRLREELAGEREELARLERLVAERDVAIRDMQADAERRIETERASTTEVHARLATAREEAQRTMVAEAEETERLRAELDRSREDAEKLLAAERAEVARLREELLNSETLGDEPDEASRRMLERVTRDLDRERAATRTLRRELETLRSDSAELRRAESSAVANGTLATDEAPVDRTVRTPLGTQRRVEAARHGASRRIPRQQPRWSVWVARVIAALAVAAVGIAFVLLVHLVH